MSHDQTQEVLEAIAQLQQRLEKLEVSKKVKKAVGRHGHPPKAYEGLSGNYFEFQKTDDCETYQSVKDQLDNCLTDTEFRQDLSKNNLGRAIINYYQQTGNLIFWAPNQTALMFGHARSGVTDLNPSERFSIPQSKLILLGKHDGDKVGKIQVELLVNFQQFMEDEVNEKRRLKYEAALQKISTPKKK